MVRVYFVREEKVVDVPQGANLRQVALDNGIELYEFPHNLPLMNCRGKGICGTCRVRVADSSGLTPRSRWEAFRLGQEEALRLACQCEVTGDVEATTRPVALGWVDHPFYQDLKR